MSHKSMINELELELITHQINHFMIISNIIPNQYEIDTIIKKQKHMNPKSHTKITESVANIDIAFKQMASFMFLIDFNETIND